MQYLFLLVGLSFAQGLHFDMNATRLPVATLAVDSPLQVFTAFEVHQQPGVSPRPPEKHYKVFYDGYDGSNKLKIDFVKDLPANLIQDAASVEMFILRATLSKEFEKRADNMKPKKGNEVDISVLTHNGVGFLLKDKDGVELRRLSFSYWAVLGNRVDYARIKKDGSMAFFNRAIVAYTHTKGNWEWGYWGDQVPMKTLSMNEFSKAMKFSLDFANKHPYIAGGELWMDDQLLRPAVTCNTYVHELIWMLMKKDVYEEKILPMAFYKMALTAKTTTLFAGRGGQEEDVVIMGPKRVDFYPLFYDSHGVLKEVGNDNDVPHTVYATEVTNIAVRSNIAPEIKLNKQEC